jgi:two-component system OmpR family response regulator
MKAKSDMPKRVYFFDGWRLDPGRRQLFNPRGIEVRMTSAEFDLLLYLCQRPQQVVPRHDLMPRVGGRVVSMERAVDVRVARIRRKVEMDANAPALIKTIRYEGYWFTPDVIIEE